jgi:hypothetical protein
MAGDKRVDNRTAANRTLVALELYAHDARKLAGSWRDLELHARVSRELDDLRHCCHDLPTVSVQWIALLIAHAELMHCLWRTTRPESGTTAMHRQLHLERLIVCAQSLRTACVRAGGDAGPGTLS